VFSTKDREPWLTPAIMEELVPYFGGVLRELGGTLLDANGPEDHVHVAAILKPTMAVSEAIGKLKSNSSRWFKERFGRSAFAWQDGYSAFSVSYSGVPQVLSYVGSQVEHHRKRSYIDELKLLLKAHDIPFEEKYLS
jgi:REP element-mobilizing transposase RayT